MCSQIGRPGVEEKTNVGQAVEIYHDEHVLPVKNTCASVLPVAFLWVYILCAVA